MKKLKIELTPQAMNLLEQLFQTGLFGLTIEEVAQRFIYDALLERLNKPTPMIVIPKKPRRRK